MAVGYKDLLEGRDTGSGHSAKDVFKKYFSRLPLFIGSVAVCVGIAYMYVRYTVPRYKATTLILVKDNRQNPGSSNAAAGNDILENAMNGLATINLENELQRLRSSRLMQRVVSNNGFNITYYLVGKVRTSDIYRSSPFMLVPQVVSDSSQVHLTISKLTPWGATVSFEQGGKKNIAVRWNTSFEANGKKFLLQPKQSSFDVNAVYKARWLSTPDASKELMNNFSVGTSGTKTTIIELTLLYENLDKAKDILNAVAAEFRQSNIEELNTLTQNTIQFIDERLSLVSNELKDVEGNLENFQGSNQAFDLSQQSTKSFENSDETSKRLADVNVQLKVVEMVRQSLTNQGNTAKLIPSTLGIDDATLSSLVTRYNELVLKKERESSGLGEQSLIMQDLNSQLADLKNSISNSLRILNDNLELQRSNLAQQGSRYNSTMSALPRKERVLQEIKRQQGIKEGLFLYLLQKREEAAITRTSQPSSYEQIDPASGYGPVQPNKSTAYKLALLIGLLLPFGFIYLRELFNDKIITRDDITRKTAVPIAGEISHIKRLRSRMLPSLKQDLTGEQFRLIRSNLAFLQKQKDKQVILVTSTTSGEGKSFISLNLAAVMAKAGRRVALLELDLRKPHEHLADGHSKGITDFLVDGVHPEKIAFPMEGLPNLHIFPAGPFIPDPADLLLDEKVGRLFEYLKTRYDAIVINSAPAGLVSDVQILGSYSELVVYIIRQGFTTKKQMAFIEDQFRTGKLKNMCLVFNDVRTGVKYGYDGYGYSKDNAYYHTAVTTVRRSVWTKMKNTVGLN